MISGSGRRCISWMLRMRRAGRPAPARVSRGRADYGRGGVRPLALISTLDGSFGQWSAPALITKVLCVAQSRTGSFTLETRITRSESAVYTEVGEEIVALNLTKGVCYGLDQIAARIWQLLETPRSAAEIAEILVDEFDVSPEVCLQQTLDFLRELARADLAR